MANTTNFGWETPDDTDLVKDGALAMRTLGNAIDTSLVDLKGGTTGQVLSKTSNTDMDFTWVTSDDANAIQNAIVDAKGDLITATAADTPARLAVGSNGDNLVADSSATAGLRWQNNFAAAKNKVINGDFGIWQRGTSFTNPTNGTYTADRWRVANSTDPTSRSVTQETFTPGTAPVAGYESSFFLRSTLTTVGSSTAVRVNHRVEDVRTFAGQTITLSFWAKTDTNRTCNYQVTQAFGSGGSANVDAVANTTFSTTSTWTRYSFTFSVPSISGKTIGAGNTLQFFIGQELTNGCVLDIWGVQLEASNTATAFQTASGSQGSELALCQRYYEKSDVDTIWSGDTTNAAVYYIMTPFKVTKRATTTVTTTNVGGLNFGAGNTIVASLGGFRENRTATADGSGSYFISSWTASAEL